MRSTRRALLIGGLATTAVTALPSLSPALAAATAPGAPVSPTLFGLHDATGFSYSNLAPGSIRLWDVGVSWSQLENGQCPTGEQYCWHLLDDVLTKFGIIKGSIAPNAPKVTYTIGYTPQAYGAPSDPPPLNALDSFVRGLVTYMVTNYPGVMDYYQVWNEPSDPQFYTGNDGHLRSMTRTVYQAVALDPTARVLAPSFPVRRLYQRNWFKQYLTDGTVPNTSDPVWNYFDRVGFSMYPPTRWYVPTPNDTPTFYYLPEARQQMLDEVRDIMSTATVGGVHMPGTKRIAHASEVNCDVDGNASPPNDTVLVSDDLQIAYTMRTYLMAAIAGFERVSWYRYHWGYKSDGSPWGNTFWSDPNDHSILTPAGAAFNRIRSWMSGTFNSFTVDDTNGNYYATFGSKKIAWRRQNNTSTVTGYQGKTITRHDGTTFVAGNNLTLTSLPIMIQ